MQDSSAAATKWGAVGTWDVSGVGDFSHAFSTWRNVGGSFAAHGNPKAATFVGTGISSWKTTSATLMNYMFRSAGAMNADLGGWSVAKVTTLSWTFIGASEFVGTGLAKWNTAKVEYLSNTFSEASKFAGTGIGSWDTAAVISLSSTFNKAGEMNADLSGWRVGEVTTMSATFDRASKFVGTGLGSWDTAKVTTMSQTFYLASKFAGTGLGSWDTASVTTLASTFNRAGMNVDVSGWDVAKVANMGAVFMYVSREETWRALTLPLHAVCAVCCVRGAAY